MGLYDEKNDLSILDELENIHFIGLLNEMAENKKELMRLIKSRTTIINEHILKCLLIQNSTNNLKHWAKEIRSFLPDVPILKSSRKYPDEKLLKTCTLGYFSDSLLNKIDDMVSSINYEENTNIIEYNKDLLYKGILNYYKWLIPILSKKGSVSLPKVVDEISTLIDDYNKSI